MVRYKSRWFSVEVEWERGGAPTGASVGDVVQAVKDSIATNFGLLGAVKHSSGLKVVYVNWATNIFLLRTPQAHSDICWVSLLFLTELCGQRVALRVIHRGGTLRKCQCKVVDVLDRFLQGQPSSTPPTTLEKISAEVEAQKQIVMSLTAK